MKSFDELFKEDKQGTLELLYSLYDNKLKSFKWYFHSLAIYVILSLALGIYCNDLQADSVYWIGLCSLTSIGVFLCAKTMIHKNNLKQLIKHYESLC